MKVHRFGSFTLRSWNGSSGFGFLVPTVALGKGVPLCISMFSRVLIRKACGFRFQFSSWAVVRDCACKKLCQWRLARRRCRPRMHPCPLPACFSRQSLWRLGPWFVKEGNKQNQICFQRERDQESHMVFKGKSQERDQAHFEAADDCKTIQSKDVYFNVSSRFLVFSQF